MLSPLAVHYTNTRNDKVNGKGKTVSA